MVVIEKKSKVIRFKGLSDIVRIVMVVEEEEEEEEERWPWTVMAAEEEEEERLDPVEKLGSDLMGKILAGLDARSLTRALCVSRSWFSLASSDSLWSPLCDQLWVGKAHIPRWSTVPGLPKFASYSRAVIDSKRVHVTMEDLLDHAWEFHFTEAAPSYWKDLDPYWGRAGPPMQRHFHSDGSVTADPEDVVWGGHECSYKIVTGVDLNGQFRENYVRINRWPHLSVSRRKDWGWVMSNFVSSYSSIPDSSKGATGPILNSKDMSSFC